MITFGVGALLMVLLAAAFVAWPLRRAGQEGNPAARRAGNLAAWRSERDELDRQLGLGTLDARMYEAACRELDLRLLEETASEDAAKLDEGGVRGLLVLLVLIPAVAVLIYASLGAMRSVQLDAGLSALDRIEDPAERNVAMVRLLPELEAVARSRDPDGGYRYLLGRSYVMLGRHAEAAALFGELSAMYPDDAGLIAQQAQALYLAADRQMSPAVQSLIDRAFAIDPSQVTVLGMVGMDRFQSGDYAGAVQAWETLLARLPADAPDAAVIRDGIAMARTRAGGDGPAEQPAVDASHGEEVATGSSGPVLSVSVRLGDGVSAPEGATVFVFARAVGGPPMPLAVARFGIDELPRDVRLDDSMAMAPGMKLSNFSEVTVVARVSRSGTVAAGPGDLEGSSEPISLGGGEQALVVTIDRTL